MCVITIEKNISNSKFLSRLCSNIRVKDYRNQRRAESEDLGFYDNSTMNNKIPRKAAILVAVFPLVDEIREKPKSTEVVQFVLKQRAGRNATSPSYKLNVVRFNDGTVGEWLEVRKAIAEQWTQNSIDRAPRQGFKRLHSSARRFIDGVRGENSGTMYGNGRKRRYNGGSLDGGDG